MCYKLSITCSLSETLQKVIVFSVYTACLSFVMSSGFFGRTPEDQKKSGCIGAPNVRKKAPYASEGEETAAK